MTEETTSVPEITVSELRDRLESGAPVTVVDIRPRDDFEEWRIPGSVHAPGLADPDGEGARDFPDRLPDGSGPVVTVCPSGNSSRTAARHLREHGRDAYSLAGGLRAWTLAWNTADLDLGRDAPEVVQIRRTGKGCLSYLVGSGEEALAIDPALDPEVFEAEAERRGWRITGVLETHVHADHLSRARELARSVDARLHLPDGSDVDFPHRSLGDGEAVAVGDAELEAVSTPGHTPESTSYRLGDDVVFTGDTLFLDGVGRPDLDADAEGGREKARRLHDSLLRLTKLPDRITVLPAHTASAVPFDGEAVGASLGEVRKRIPVLSRTVRAFVRDILEEVPPTPANHEEIIALNRGGGSPVQRDVVDLEAGANRCAAG